MHHERCLLLSVAHRIPEKPHFRLLAVTAWFVAALAYVVHSDALSAAAVSATPVIVGRPVHYAFSNCGRVGGALLRRDVGVGGGMLLWGREAH